jgi:thiamine kinase-like enzyme
MKLKKQDKDFKRYIVNKIKKALKHYHKELDLGDFKLNNIEVNPLGNGENHLIYLASVGGKLFVFRISFRRELESALKKEFEILKKLSSGLGPKPFIFDNSKKIIPNSFMIQSFISGKKIKKWTKDLLRIHAKQLALLHSKNITEKKENLYDVFIKRANFSKNNQPEVVKDDKLIKEVFVRLNKIFSKNKQILENQKHSYLIHADLHDDNILVKDNKLHYVDWEEARYGDNALDVASLLWFIKLDDEKYKTYLNTYLENLKDEDLEKRMILWLLYKDFSLLLHKKWQSLKPETRAIKSNEDYNKTIKEIIKRLEKRMEHFNQL